MQMTLLLAFSLTSGVAFAQEPARAASPATAQVDARFTHWLGCWRLEDDLAGTGARLRYELVGGSPTLVVLDGGQRYTVGDTLYLSGSDGSGSHRSCQSLSRALARSPRRLARR